MKKLLLLSLLALSATSFSATFTGNEQYVAAPVKVSGTVVEPTASTLVITTDDTTGNDGTGFMFDFGNLPKLAAAKTYERSGSFTVKRQDGGNFTGTSITVGLMNSTTGVDASQETAGTGTTLGGNGKIAYLVNSNAALVNQQLTSSKVVEGSIEVAVTVGDNATTGVFLDTSKKILAYLQ